MKIFSTTNTYQENILTMFDELHTNREFIEDIFEPILLQYADATTETIDEAVDSLSAEDAAQVYKQLVEAKSEYLSESRISTLEFLDNYDKYSYRYSAGQSNSYQDGYLQGVDDLLSVLEMTIDDIQ